MDLRFALLEHRTSEGVHWDLLLEVAGQSRLATWRLAANPCITAGPIRCERIADHRRVYLEYEGPISGGRGDVKRVDGGAATWLAPPEQQTAFELRGGRLWGRYRIRQGEAGLEFVPEAGS